MEYTPLEHRPAPNDRNVAERELGRLGWTAVRLPRTEPTRKSLQFIDMIKWCEDNIGTGRVEVEHDKIDNNDSWYSFSWYGHWNFWFRKQEDATLFALRWS